MGKDRLQAFYDAMLAIIMTICVLEFKVPSDFSPESMADLGETAIAYTISFFWLATMWIGQHNQMQMISRISARTPWWFMILAFFCSFFPFLTELVAKNFFDPWAQLLYGVDVIIIAIVNSLMFRSLIKANPENEVFKEVRKRGEKITVADAVIKVAGIVVGFLVYPPAVLVSIVISGLLYVYEEIRMDPGRKEQIRQALESFALSGEGGI